MAVVKCRYCSHDLEVGETPPGSLIHCNFCDRKIIVPPKILDTSAIDICHPPLFFPKASPVALPLPSAPDIIGGADNVYIHGQGGKYQLLLTSKHVFLRSKSRFTTIIGGILGFLALPICFAAVNMGDNLKWQHFVAVVPPALALLFIALWLDERSEKKFKADLTRLKSIETPHFALATSDLANAIWHSRYGGEAGSNVVPCTVLLVAGTEISVSNHDLGFLRAHLRELLSDEAVGTAWLPESELTKEDHGNRKSA